MAFDPETPAAGWVAAQARRRVRLLLAGGVIYALVYAALIALAVGHRLSVTASLLVVAVVLWLRPRAEHRVDALLHWRLGAKAEAEVGVTLDELRREGWIVMHDIEQAQEGNVDHLVSGPSGVFLVETKARRYQDRDLVKARRQAAKVNRELGVWITPVICLHERDGEPFHTHGVWIVPRRRLLGWLRRQRNRQLPFERLARFADRL